MEPNNSHSCSKTNIKRKFGHSHHYLLVIDNEFEALCLEDRWIIDTKIRTRNQIIRHAVV